MKYSLCFLPVLLLVSTSLVAQTIPQTSNAIKGSLVDGAQKPIPYGAVALYMAADSSLVTGTTSGETGEFELLAEPGLYYLKISILSFKEKIVPNLTVTDQPVQVGAITLRPDTELLEEVTVRGERSMMELQLDKRVFNVGSDLSNIGGSAAEILDNVPSVSVDVEGNVSLRGSQNVRILIDGRPSGLTGISSPDALRQLQGNLIERIEVITNPSSRYDAEGEVGIINIILKKNRNQGVNGSFTVNVGTPANYGGSFDINYRKNKINLFSSYGVNYRSRPGFGSSYQSFTGSDSTFSYSETNRRTRGGISHNFRVGLDYYLNDKNVLTGSVLYRRSDGRNTSRYVYRDFGPLGELIQTTERNEREREPENNIEAALSFSREYDRAGRTLTADVKWIVSDEDEFSTFQQGVLGGPVNLRQRSSNTEDERNFLFQADYVHPFGEKSKWEAGVKSTSRVLNNDFLVEQQEEGEGWLALPRFDNNLIYRENIHAAYLMAGNQFRKVSLQAGLRGEFSDISTELPEENLVNQRTYFNLFPSVHLSYALNKDKALQLSYSYRLSRPGFRELLPFSGFSNARSLMVGNPNLNPEYTHSLEAGHLLNWSTGSLLSSMYYRYRLGVIQRITLVDSVGFNRIFPVNLATQNAYGLEFNYSNTIKNWWRLNANFNFYRAITSGRYQDQLLESDTYTWTSRVTSKMTVLRKWEFQAGVNYRAPQQIPQGRELSSYAIDLGLSRDVMKGNGTFTLSVRDLLNTRLRRTIIEQEGYYSTSSFQWNARQILLTFNYRLNRKKEARESMDGENEGEN
ncbi:TonB-dependent receptor domain-containing protein [Telluribacter sp.]|jgi:outer membrane receptor protein involved in Fe transport|uniref:TonB-dependent receptor domain-containing protein n=1 Tax=Telluribacter sp. TaxID=1978767 RepID=UPI002E109F8B|nr:TonB-dependent receptor [Telluribacter sp.]